MLYLRGNLEYTYEAPLAERGKEMPTAPKSYINERRPSLNAAIRAERDVTFNTIDVFEILERKGYFTARPRPWRLGRGHGRGGFAVLDRFGDLVAEIPQHADAELIVTAVNAYQS